MKSGLDSPSPQLYPAQNTVQYKKNSRPLSTTISWTYSKGSEAVSGWASICSHGDGPDWGTGTNPKGITLCSLLRLIEV